MTDSHSLSASVLDDRAKQVLRCLVRRYLRDGQPVPSSALARATTLSYSPATIRHVMADLEDIGFLVSPHTSAGRIPSPRGIRFFVDHLLTVVPPTRKTVRDLTHELRRETVTEVHSAAAAVISQLTKYVGFVAAPAMQPPVVRQLRFVKLSSNRVLAVIVTGSGDVLNRVFNHDEGISERDLTLAAAAYNRYCANMTFNDAQTLLHSQMLELRAQISRLLESLLKKVGEDPIAKADMLCVAGEMNLLKDDDLSGDMQQLRELYDLLQRKKELIRLLERGAHANNVHVFIGSESGLSALEQCSVVFSSCSGSDGKALGLIGVVGPKRMRYNKVIPTVDVAAQLLGNVLTDLRLSA